MKSVFIFAGTTEGRELALLLAARHVPCIVSVVSEYGSLLVPEQGGITVLQGRMNRAQMCAALAQGEYACVVDATHPYAVAASREIAAACAQSDICCLRLSRSIEYGAHDSGRLFSCMEEAARWLEGQDGRILATTGTKELPLLTRHISHVSRIYARVLPAEESLRICAECGIRGDHIIAMQGPFSQAMNVLLLREWQIAFLLTKESGAVGGYGEKLEAARQCHVTPVIIRSPEAPRAGLEQAYTFPQLLAELERITGVPLRRESAGIILVGTGPGNASLLTDEARKGISDADVIFGADSVLPAFSVYGKPLVPMYRFDQVAAYLAEHPAYEKPAVVFSGDVGFYSGASAFVRDCTAPWACRLVPGVSVAAYFAARLGVPWQDWTLLSMHGRFCNVVGKLRTHARCFLLLSSCDDVRKLGWLLVQAVENKVLGSVHITAGYQLSLPEEQIVSLTLAQMRACWQPGLYVLLLEHDGAVMDTCLPGLPDECFIRARVPMTKREVRAVAISLLQPPPSAIVYDIGSGTGAVTVELARACEDGMVYAVECDEAAAALTEENVRRFCLQNVRVIRAQAPAGMEDLPVPTHIYIGGNSGLLPKILAAALCKNPRVRIVIAAVTLETLSLAQASLRELPVTASEYVQVSVSRSRLAGAYHLMYAQNPVYLISCTGSPGARDGR